MDVEKRHVESVCMAFLRDDVDASSVVMLTASSIFVWRVCTSSASLNRCVIFAHTLLI